MYVATYCTFRHCTGGKGHVRLVFVAAGLASGTGKRVANAFVGTTPKGGGWDSCDRGILCMVILQAICELSFALPVKASL